MALIYRDRIRQKSVASGTGPLTLSASVDTYLNFAQANLGANSFPYLILNSNQFEVGVGTYSASTLYRNLVLSNSNGTNDTNFINFNGTLADVIITNPSELSVLTSTQPISNTKKLVKWVNSEFQLVDPVIHATELGSGIQSSVIYYDSTSASFAADPSFKFFPGTLPEVYVQGVIQATAKAFKIKHPIKPNMYLIHGCLEGPEHGIYFRRSIESNYKVKVFLPDYFSAITHDDYIVNVNKNSFMPIKINKYHKYFEIIPLFYSFKKIKFDCLIIASRKDVKFELEKNVR